MHCLRSITLLACAAVLSYAQYPPEPSGMTVVQSKVNPEVRLSFKETEICEQPAGSKTYSGFVHLPGSTLVDLGGYDINTYFIYFEARNSPSTAPLAMYFAGGPGESSLYSALSGENGPCYVKFDADGTVRSEWSLNEYANVLYIDQPSQTGFSYGSLINGTFNLVNGVITPLEADEHPPPVNATFGYGTFPSQSFDDTANTTVQAASQLWHFAENWLSSFPGYRTTSTKIGIWGNSYGGYWVPEVAVQFHRHLASLSAEHPLACEELVVDNIGITNGCIDFHSAIAGYPEIAYNNTYGVRFGSEAVYDAAMHNITKPHGCLDLIKQCRVAGEAEDPDFSGNNAKVNELCMEALGFCEQYVVNSFPKLDPKVRDPFDFAVPAGQIVNPLCPFYLEVNTYLNTAAIQQSLGVPQNFTQDSSVVATNFGVPGPYPNRPITKQTGDTVRQNGLPNLEYLLANNVKVAMIFGDRDFRCPWTGGEMTALATKWSGQSTFSTAGYERLKGITKKGTDHGAVVKQAGLLSFSRVLDSGHSVSAYAPQTVATIFERTLKGVDVATGSLEAVKGYVSNGPASSWKWQNKLPKHAPKTCVVNGRFQKKSPWAALLKQV